MPALLTPTATQSCSAVREQLRESSQAQAEALAPAEAARQQAEAEARQLKKAVAAQRLEAARAAQERAALEARFGVVSGQVDELHELRRGARRSALDLEQ
jgi:chromosome segregation ATPase|eukprot:COSAG01_NODE_13660_length_1552_cov_1.346869_2_plen_100_part_00